MGRAWSVPPSLHLQVVLEFTFSPGTPFGWPREGTDVPKASKHCAAQTRARFPGSWLCVFPAKTSSPLPITPQVGYVEKYEIWIEYMGLNLTSPFPSCTILEIFLKLSVCLFSFLPLCLPFFQHVFTVNLLYARCLVESGRLDITWIQLC